MGKIKRYTNFERAKVLAYLGKNRALYECPEGHKFRTSVFPKSPIGTIPSEDMCRCTAERWMRAGVRINCPQCERAAKAA